MSEAVLQHEDHAIEQTRPSVAAVIPCYRVREQIEAVLRNIGPEVSRIFCVDDDCPENSGQVVEKIAKSDSRIEVIRHEQNTGVGGAVVTGYRRTPEEGAEILVKIDGDGQMDPQMISQLIDPIIAGHADYVKGNRFFHLDGLKSMPWSRLVGNAGLSFLTKFATGYWNLFDPANGFTAIHAKVARVAPLDNLDTRYFFESDMLFHLNLLRAVVVEVPMDARYADENSSLNPARVLFEFPVRLAFNTVKRLFYNYFLRNFSVASVHLVFGCLLLAFGVVFGATQWIQSIERGEFASSGTVMVAALPVILGVQFLLNFIGFDMANLPRDPIHQRLRDVDSSRTNGSVR